MENIIHKKIENLEESINAIKDNHIAHIKDDVAGIKIDMASTKTNVDWLMRSYWIVVTSSLGALVAGVIGIMLK